MDIEKLNKVVQNLPTKKTTELDKSHTFLVTGIRKVDTRYGTKVVVELDNECQTFLPIRMSSAMINDEKLFENIKTSIDNEKLYIHFVNSNVQFKVSQI